MTAIQQQSERLITLAEWSEDWRELWRERAAIMQEGCKGLSKEEADRLAFEDIKKVLREVM